MIYTVIDDPLPWQERGLQQTASGYGAKLTSRFSVQIDGDKRKRRVYITRWSNAGSAWFFHEGGKVFIPDTAIPGDRIEGEKFKTPDEP
jgi:hypothetical protein